MAVSSVLSFWLLAALLIVVPGPDWAFAIGAGLRRRVLPAATGIVLGYLIMTVVVAAGLGLLIASTSAALTLLTVAGGAYLIWLGTSTLRHPATLADPIAGSRTSWTTVLQGVLVSGLNPKGLLIFLALLPQFSDPDATWPVPIQLAALGATFALTCAAVYLCVGSAAKILLRARPSVARIVSRVSGASMVALGCLLLVEHLTA
ncbi:LysE family translocator [Solicola gregarius]|uniref:LysE family translocator n=1 Tax=Solicola gregarius TaxID=2908642 RepID=A0AA46TL26_9ACTN|nr:LysE family translocator [Solicola gregarius]UYM07098.1 LysE family translocator [Solicola gregarius]